MYYEEHAEIFLHYDVHLSSRTIYLQPDTDQFQFEWMVKGLVVLTDYSLDPITVIMNCPGGDEYHGVAVYDAIKLCQAPVTIEAYGHSMSMGSWILQAADLRLLAPSCMLMIHYGTWGYTTSIPVQRSLQKEMERVNTAMEDVYLEGIHQKHPRFARSKLQAMLHAETYLTAQEAVDLGLADGILE